MNSNNNQPSIPNPFTAPSSQSTPDKPQDQSTDEVGQRDLADLIKEMQAQPHQYAPPLLYTDDGNHSKPQVTYVGESEPDFEREDEDQRHQTMANCRMPPNRSPLRGIREQENEDVSEITYRTSNIYLADEENHPK